MEFFGPKIRLLNEAVSSSDVWDKLDSIMDSLEEQGVLRYFVNCEKLDYINEFLSNQIGELFRPRLNSETYTRDLAFFILSTLVERVYSEEKQNASIEDVVNILDKFVNDPNWPSVFGWLCIASTTFKEMEYNTLWKKLYQKQANATDVEVEEYKKNVREAFPMRSPYGEPSKEWLAKNINIIDAINLYSFINDEFMNMTFSIVCEIHQKKYSIEVREKSKKDVQLAVKTSLLIRTVEYLGITEQELSCDNIIKGVERFNKENPQCVMVDYYFAMTKAIGIYGILGMKPSK